jgi:hypothetical protein
VNLQWEKLPRADDLGNVVCDIASAMDDILEKAGQLPKPEAVVFVRDPHC